jgi:hypothetical protein
MEANIDIRLFKSDFVNQYCASSGDSELGRVSSGWINEVIETSGRLHLL